MASVSRFLFGACRRATIVALMSGFAAAAFVGAFGTTAPARADSLVFVKRDGNVWLARPDGSRQRRVTSDGSAANGYYSPSQSTHGTIEVARGRRTNARLYRLSRTGKRLNAPFRVGVPVINPEISPDGSKVAFSTFTSGAPCYGLLHHTFFCFRVSSSNHYTTLTQPAWMNFEYPTWMGNSRLLLFYNSGTLAYSNLGQSGYKTWFSWLDYFSASTSGFGEWISGAASVDGKRLALVTHVDNQSRFAIQVFSGPTDVRVGHLTSYKPTLSPCTLNAPDGGKGVDPKHPELPAFDSVSFSPHGGSIAYGYKGAIYVASIGSLTNCGRIIVRKVIKAGTNPNWGRRS